MIEIKKSKTADTRTCDYENVTKKVLLESSVQHIGDVQRGFLFFINMMAQSADKHDFTKLTEIAMFHKDFISGFKTQDWYNMHKKIERHHIDFEDGVREDVNLIDVLEHIIDCVMAGMGRSGEVRNLKLEDELLQKAFKNTVDLLKNNVRVREEEEK